METLEGYLKVAYETVINKLSSKHTINMSTGWASNQAKFSQTFTMLVHPSNNRLPKYSNKHGGTIMSSPIGYRELIVWIYFGNNFHWVGPEFKWIYMNRSNSSNGEHISGDMDNIELLYKASNEMELEYKRIIQIESDYQDEHGTLEGLIIEGYYHHE